MQHRQDQGGDDTVAIRDSMPVVSKNPIVVSLYRPIACLAEGWILGSGARGTWSSSQWRPDDRFKTDTVPADLRSRAAAARRTRVVAN
jgi:hypothetical protein